MLQVVREDDKPSYALMQFDNPESAVFAMNNYRKWMPGHVVLEWFRSPDEGHRDNKHPKTHHKLFLDVPRSQFLFLNNGCSMPSVERITVKSIKHETCAAKIYGKVMVFDPQVMQFLYRRGPSQSEEKRSGDDLELRGPNRSALDSLFGIEIVINLLEERDGQERVFARGFLGCRLDVREGFFEDDVGGDGGVVSVVYANVPVAAWTRVSVGGGLLSKTRVSGCIKAWREIAGEQREFVMFSRALDNPVAVGLDGFLCLDRSCVIISKWYGGLTISVSLKVHDNNDADGRNSCDVQKDMVFDAVFEMESQTIDVFGGQVTVSLTYEDTPGCEDPPDASYSDDDETGFSGPHYAEVQEVSAAMSAQRQIQS